MPNKQQTCNFPSLGIQSCEIIALVYIGAVLSKDGLSVTSRVAQRAYLCGTSPSNHYGFRTTANPSRQRETTHYASLIQAASPFTLSWLIETPRFKSSLRWYRSTIRHCPKPYIFFQGLLSQLIYHPPLQCLSWNLPFHWLLNPCAVDPVCGLWHLRSCQK